MRNWFPAALAILVIALYGALGWRQLVAGVGLVAPSSGTAIEQRRAATAFRYSFERGGRNCRMPSWRG